MVCQFGKIYGKVYQFAEILGKVSQFSLPNTTIIGKKLNKASVVFSCNGYFVEGILFHTSRELILSSVQVLRSYSTDASNY